MDGRTEVGAAYLGQHRPSVGGFALPGAGQLDRCHCLADAALGIPQGSPRLGHNPFRVGDRALTLTQVLHLLRVARASSLRAGAVLLHGSGRFADEAMDIGQALAERPRPRAPVVGNAGGLERRLPGSIQGGGLGLALVSQAL